MFRLFRENLYERLQQFVAFWLVATMIFAPSAGWAGDQNNQGGNNQAGNSQGESTIQQIKHIVVIYQENWSFDSLYGEFPGANGRSNASAQSLNQVDRFGVPYVQQLGQPFNRISAAAPQFTTPPQPINTNVTPNAIDSRFPANLDTLHPYDAQDFIQTGDKTGDIVHRYWNHFSQINGGNNNKYVAWSDNPGLVMSYFDATNLPEGKLAQEFTIGDNFFHSAFGGSFLNHQFLIAATAPVFPNAATVTPNSIATVDSTGQLALNASGRPAHDGNVTPIGGVTPTGTTFDKNYAVNTIYSKNLVPTFKKTTDVDLLPSQNDSNPNDTMRRYIPTIGDRLDAKHVSWKYYAGGFDAAIASTPTNPMPAVPATVDPLFQWHHQPFAYYDNYAPFNPDGTRNQRSVAHLQDETRFFADVQNETPPSVSFIKPLGPNNEHPGYADLLTGQQHVADIVKAIQQSKYWHNTLIIVTYDEFGGRWDHVAPPRIDQWGPGARVPGIFIGLMVKRGFVDHTQYETTSILRLIEKRFDLKPLSTRDAQANPFTNIFRNNENEQ
jgi:phospholipase C